MSSDPHGAGPRRPAATLPDPAGYVIEIDDEAVGLVTTHPQGMAFHAVHTRAQALDGQVFADAAAARSAAESAFYGWSAQQA
ncbi:hypothetical protein [Azospirillum sp. B4]|uniref:hypothetical protein n=1 Tax=Azospirillum sp. B4 TaxID=95605 RepID=UPI0011DD518C|nr:hypothetical protein [Azospirillum sp. B4]